MIAAVAGGRDLSLGAGFVLAVGEHGETHSAIGHRPVVIDCAALARRRVIRIRMMRSLRTMHHVHPLGGLIIAARLLRRLASVPALAPEVALIHVMVVG